MRKYVGHVFLCVMICLAWRGRSKTWRINTWRARRRGVSEPCSNITEDALPLQDLWGRSPGTSVRVFTTGTSPEGPLTGTFTVINRVPAQAQVLRLAPETSRVGLSVCSALMGSSWGRLSDHTLCVSSQSAGLTQPVNSECGSLLRWHGSIFWNDDTWFRLGKKSLKPTCFWFFCSDIIKIKWF